MLKKLSKFSSKFSPTNNGRKMSNHQENNHDDTMPYTPRQARSMDILHKPYMSQAGLPLGFHPMDGSGSSSHSVSPVGNGHPPTRGGATAAATTATASPHSHSSPPASSSPASCPIDGVPHTTSTLTSTSSHTTVAQPRPVPSAGASLGNTNKSVVSTGHGHPSQKSTATTPVVDASKPPHSTPNSDKSVPRIAVMSPQPRRDEPAKSKSQTQAASSDKDKDDEIENGKSSSDQAAVSRSTGNSGAADAAQGSTAPVKAGSGSDSSTATTATNATNTNAATKVARRPSMKSMRRSSRDGGSTPSSPTQAVTPAQGPPPLPPITTNLRTSATPTTRQPPPHLKNLPPSILNRMSIEGLRLSPSIITRQPMPMRLPTLPLLTPIPVATGQGPGQGARGRERPHSAARLRSMPALPHQGPNDRGEEEEADLEEEDEEGEEEGEDEGPSAAAAGSDEEDGDMDDEGTEVGHQLHSHLNQPNQSPVLPPVDTSRIDLSFLNYPIGPSGNGRDVDATPIATHSSDYFSTRYSDGSKNTNTNNNNNDNRSPNRTPRAGLQQQVQLPQNLAPRTPALLPTPPKIVPLPSTPTAERPSIYKHASRSMIDILPTGRERLTSVLEEENKESFGKGKGKGKEGLREGLSGKEGLGLSGRAATTQDGLMGSGSGTRVGNGSTSAQARVATAPAEHDRDISSPINAHAHTLQRRRSMPMFNPTTLPPPYPHFAPHPMSKHIKVLPRDDEGRERLPPYSNAIYLKAVMPRKMEFSAPGVQAKDRKWRRVVCVLEGTAFRVYECPRGVIGVGVFGGWWERKVGVGDVSIPVVSAPGGAGVKAQKERRERERVAKLDLEAATGGGGSEGVGGREQTHTAVQLTVTSESARSKKGLASHFLKPSSNSNSNSGSGSGLGKPHLRSRSEVNMPQNGAGPSASPRPSLNLQRPPSNASRSSGVISPVRSSSSLATTIPASPTSHTSHSTTNPASSASTNSTTTASLSSSASMPLPSSASSSSTSSHFMSNPFSSETDIPTENLELIRTYTLQHAESGLGNDYLKRKNVIRVRMDGEQFLLQARNIPAVVEWIEGFHAATNIALDLDERLMPKGPMFPRRRRRRPRPPASQGSDNVRPVGSS